MWRSHIFIVHETLFIGFHIINIELYIIDLPYFIGIIFINWTTNLKCDIRLFCSLKPSFLMVIQTLSRSRSLLIIQFSKVGFRPRFTKLDNELKETPITWTNQPIKLKEKVKLISRAHRWLRVSRAQRWLRVFTRSTLVTCCPALNAGLRVFPRLPLITCFPAVIANYIFFRAYPRWYIFLRLRDWFVWNFLDKT